MMSIFLYLPSGYLDMDDYYDPGAAAAAADYEESER